MARFRSFLPFVASAFLFPLAASAQPLPEPFPRPGVLPSAGPGGAAAPSPPSDCAVTGLLVSIRTRRTVAVVDITTRLKAIHGGLCSLQPQAVQVLTSRSVVATRLLSVAFAEGQPLLPMTLADAPGGADRPLPLTRRLAPGTETFVTLRTVVEGETLANGDVDAPARVRVDLSQLGARLVAGAPLDVRVALEAGSAGRITVATGNPHRPGVPQVTGPGGTLSLTQPLGKEDVIPLVEWRYEGDAPPAVTSEGLAGGGLPVIEYLRDGLARELSLAIADPKNVKQVTAGWDTAFGIAYVAAQTSDPLVAGLGLRALAWLSSGLSYTVSDVKSATDTGREGAIVPDELLNDVRPALPLFSSWSGRPTPPPPVSARTLRTLGPALGEPNAHRKEADDGLKRLVKNRAVVNGAFKIGNVVPTLGPAPAVVSPLPKTLRVLDFGPRGAFLVGERSSSAVRLPFGHRLAHALLHRPRPKVVLPAAVVLGALIGAIVLYYASVRRRKAPLEGALAAPPVRAGSLSPGRRPKPANAAAVRAKA